MSRRRAWSGITVTDQFCGAGGSSIGATKVGLEVRLALNHWKLAIETHNTNFPQTDHDCTDVSAADPRRYPSTDILITSPECTTHSPAGGSRRAKPQRDLFKAQAEDPSTARSRATMWDVPRFAEFHEYQCIIVENVLEVTRWLLFPEWLAAMEKLGYLHRIVSLNSMFCHPTPQSRDRIYIVFWRKGNRAPRLDFTPPAPCGRCGRVVEALQAWKPGRRVGKYAKQYVFQCPDCRGEVMPFYFAALNALDLGIPATRIGDRPRPLKDRTLERIRFGIEKYGRTSLIISTRYKYGLGFRTHDAQAEPLPTQPVGASHAACFPPQFLVETAYSHSEGRRPRGLDGPLPTSSARQSAALVGLPWLVNAGSNGFATRPATDPAPTMTCSERVGVAMPPFVVGMAHGSATGPGVTGADAPLPVQTTAEDRGVVLPPMAVAVLRGKSQAHGGADPLSTVSAQGGHHGLVVSPAALLTMRASDQPHGPHVRSLDRATAAQVASSAQDWLISPSPLLVSYYGTNNVAPVGEAVASITTLDRHALVGPTADLAVEDCYFRMLQPHEIGAAMAFPGTYVVLGNKRDRVKQYGNAVTPPAMEWLIRQVVASLAPEVAA